MASFLRLIAPSASLAFQKMSAYANFGPKLVDMKNWIRLSRPEFHTVAIFPLLLGAALGFQSAGVFALGPTVLALLSIVAIMLATYWLGEVYDFEVDKLSATLEKNKFSGGTLILQENPIPHGKVSNASLVAIALAFSLVFIWHGE